MQTKKSACDWFTINLNERMKRFNLSLADVAKKTKLNRATVRTAMLGLNSPSLKNAEKLARAVRSSLSKMVREPKDE